MKEITRIHIAKQAYDIELTAKKDFEKYMKKLELYAGDDEVIKDIEIRITELLLEAGVEKGGVITSNEVAKIRQTLGEPEELMASSDAGAVDGQTNEKPVRKLYRNLDGAGVGGVLNGIATYFGINVDWVRLIFILLMLASFGWALLVYIVMWIVIPPARTTAEKLQLAGKPVTLATMRDRVVSEVTQPRVAKVLKDILFIGGGIVSISVSIGAFIATMLASVALLFHDNWLGYLTDGQSQYVWMVWAAFGLFVASGVLLTALSLIVGVALFKRRMTKQTIISSIIIAVVGLMTFTGGSALIVGNSQLVSDEAQALVKTHKVALPELAGVKKINVQSHSASGRIFGGDGDMSIRYVVTTGAPRYELRTQFNLKPDIYVEGDTARITIKSVGERVLSRWYSQPELIIYGPIIDEIEVAQGGFQYDLPEGQSQSHLLVTGLETTSITLVGSYQDLEVVSSGIVDASLSSVRNLTAEAKNNASQIIAGVVYSLSARLPESCPALPYNENWSGVKVGGVTSGQMTLNGKTDKVMQHETPCGMVMIGGNLSGVDE